MSLPIKFRKMFALIMASLCLALTVEVSGQELQTLVANLKSPDVNTRRKAAKELGNRRQREAAEPLAEAIRTDSDAEVRSNALRALGLIKSFEVLPTMIDALKKDASADVRKAALLALVNLYIEKDIGFITSRRKGLNILNPFLDTDGSAIIDQNVEVNPDIIEAIAEAMRNDADEDMRIGAVRALGVLRAISATPKLVDALSIDKSVRVDVLRTFIKFGISDHGKYAIPYFNDGDAGVRSQAIEAAGLLRTLEAVPELINIYHLGEEKRGVIGTVKGTFKGLPERQKLTLRALSLIGAPKAETIFLDNIRHPDEDRRQYAYEGLARLGDKKHEEQILASYLSEKKANVKLAQAFALYKLSSNKYVIPIVEKLDSVTLDNQAYEYLFEIKPDDLYPYLRQGGMKARTKMVEVLGKTGDAKAIERLNPLLKSSDSNYVNAVNLAIERIKAREGLATKEPQQTEQTNKEEEKSEGRPRRVKKPY